MSFELSAKELARAAMLVEMGDPIDWGMLSIREEDAYLMMANQVIEILQKFPQEDQFVVAVASLTKMLVESFVLNTQLLQMAAHNG